MVLFCNIMVIFYPEFNFDAESHLHSKSELSRSLQTHANSITLVSSTMCRSVDDLGASFRERMNCLLKNRLDQYCVCCFWLKRSIQLSRYMKINFYHSIQALIDEQTGSFLWFFTILTYHSLCTSTLLYKYSRKPISTT